MRGPTVCCWIPTLHEHIIDPSMVSDLRTEEKVLCSINIFEPYNKSPGIDGISLKVLQGDVTGKTVAPVLITKPMKTGQSGLYPKGGDEPLQGKRFRAYRFPSFLLKGLERIGWLINPSSVSEKARLSERQITKMLERLGLINQSILWWKQLPWFSQTGSDSTTRSVSRGTPQGGVTSHLLSWKISKVLFRDYKKHYGGIAEQKNLDSTQCKQDRTGSRRNLR